MTKQATYTARDIRAVLGQHYDRVRITRTGEVHCYGRMPNSIVTGWFLYADSVQGAAERLWG